MSMIVFNGIKFVDRQAYLLLINANKEMVEIPVDKATADRISKYVSKLVVVSTPWYQPEE